MPALPSQCLGHLGRGLWIFQFFLFFGAQVLHLGLGGNACLVELGFEGSSLLLDGREGLNVHGCLITHPREQTREESAREKTRIWKK
jgi:hypothetical protein